MRAIQVPSQLLIIIQLKHLLIHELCIHARAHRSEMLLLTHEFIVTEGSDHVWILASNTQIPDFLDSDLDHFAFNLGSLHLKGSFLVPFDLLGHVVAEPHLVADHA